MEQIIGSFSVLIISDPCYPWEPDWYSISCVSCWFTELCSCYLPYWSSVAETKIQARKYFSSDGRLYNGSAVSRGDFCGQWPHYSRFRQWNSCAKFHQLLIIMKQDQDQYVTAIFSPTWSQISYLGLVVASGVPLLRNWCSYLTFSSHGSTCFSSSSYVHFKVNSLPLISLRQPIQSEVLFLISEWRNVLYKTHRSW